MRRMITVLLDSYLWSLTFSKVTILYPPLKRNPFNLNERFLKVIFGYKFFTFSL